MQFWEITYTKQKKQFFSFKNLYLIHSDITFSKSDQYAILHLKQSKININHIRVHIILAATNFLCCLVEDLYRLFTYDPQSLSALWFVYNNTSFISHYTIEQLRQRFAMANISFAEYSSHSFRRGVAQHVVDNGMLDEDIQKFSR